MQLEQVTGCLLGLAVGDSLGSHFEGQEPHWVRRRYADAQAFIESPPPPPWHYTDDTQMMIGVTQALIQDGQIESATLQHYFVKNYVASRGYGRGARMILQAMSEGADHRHWVDSQFPGGSFGNGAAMRVAPIGLVFRHDSTKLFEQADLQSELTHTHPLGTEGARLIAMAVAYCVSSRNFDRNEFFDRLLECATSEEYRHKIRMAAAATKLSDLESLGNGIAAHESVVTAIGCFALTPNDYARTITQAILLGGDTDTIAAMAGAISGAHLGECAVPSAWLSALEDDYQGRTFLRKLGEKLAHVCPA